MCEDPGTINIITSKGIMKVCIPTQPTSLEGKITVHDGSAFHKSGAMATLEDIEKQTQSLGIDLATYFLIATSAPLSPGTHNVLNNGEVYAVENRPYGNMGCMRVHRIKLSE